MRSCEFKDCENEVLSTNRFCSRSCAAKHNNSLFPKRLKEGSCKNCSAIINSKRSYCDECLSHGFGIKKSQYTEEQLSELKKNYVVNFRRKVKAELVTYKGGHCEKCGYDKCTDALEFHHIDPSQKDFSISGRSLSFERLKSEVDKCILVCSNCHKEIHFEQRNNMVL